MIYNYSMSHTDNERLAMAYSIQKEADMKRLLSTIVTTCVIAVLMSGCSNSTIARFDKATESYASKHPDNRVEWQNITSDNHKESFAGEDEYMGAVIEAKSFMMDLRPHSLDFAKDEDASYSSCNIFVYKDSDTANRIFDKIYEYQDEGVDEIKEFIPDYVNLSLKGNTSGYKYRIHANVFPSQETSLIKVFLLEGECILSITVNYRDDKEYDTTVTTGVDEILAEFDKPSLSELTDNKLSSNSGPLTEQIG